MSWAKLDAKVAEDRRMNAIARENPTAALLFCWSLPRADVYGILPGWTDLWVARVAPALGISHADAETVLELLVANGLYSTYEVDGERYIYIRNYHRYQSVQFCRVQPPSCQLPEFWSVPEELVIQAKSRPGKDADRRRMLAVVSELNRQGFAIEAPWRDCSENVLRTCSEDSPRTDVDTDTDPPIPPGWGAGSDDEPSDGTAPLNHCAYSDVDLNEFDVAFASWKPTRRQALRREVAEMSMDPEVQIRCRQYDDAGGELTRHVIVQELLTNRPIGGHPNSIVTEAVKAIARRLDAEERSSARASPPVSDPDATGTIRRQKVSRHAQG